MSATQVQLKTETQELICDLIENNYSNEDIYDFISEYGEDNFVSFYEDYVELSEQYSYEAVDTFIEHFDIADLPNFLDSYRGCWSSKGEYVQNFVCDCYSVDIPDFLVINWEASFEDLDCIYQDGFVFNTQF